MASDFLEDLRLARAGDREAQDRVIQRTHARVMERAHRMLGPRLRARIRTSDVVQGAYLRALKNIGHFEAGTEREFLAWMAGILENTIRDQARFFRARKRGGSRAQGGPAPDSLAAGPTPSQEAARQEDLRPVRQAMSALAPDYQKVLDLSWIEKLSHKEIAQRLGRSEGATRVLLHRARAALALEMGPSGIRPDEHG
jgi:RNA polymerase sigma-70 factor (ECF subfamily)